MSVLVSSPSLLVKNYVDHRFVLNASIDKYRKIKPKFGFNQLGYVTYYRTYSRLKPDGKQENWLDTVLRVTNGVYSIRKDYYIKHNLKWDEEYWQKHAEGFIYSIFNMHFLPPGRGLFAMGTNLIYERGSASLYNCAATTTEHLVESCDWIMDMLMNGVGCGFNTDWKGEAYKPNKSKPIFHIVDDSREGWVRATKILINSYVPDKDGKLEKWHTFNYSQIRKKGTPLKMFGGTASGAQPLVDLHQDLEKIFDMYLDDKIDKTCCVVDIINLIGVCVVAGGIRRCLPKGTLIHTTKGFVKIENVQKGMKVITANGKYKICELIHQGKQQTIKISTEIGDLICTPNHKIAVMNGIDSYKWKTALELSKTDILTYSNHIIKGSKTNLPATTCKDITIPKLDKGISWLFGYIFGNGYVYYNEDKNGANSRVDVCVFGGHINIYEKCKNELSKFGFDKDTMYILRQGKQSDPYRGGAIATTRPNEKDNSYKIRIPSKQFALYMRQFKKPNSEMIIPEFIMNGTTQIRALFLAGLFDSDGSCKTRPIKCISSVYPEFCNQIRILYSSLGIPTKITGKERKIKHWKKIYDIKIVGCVAVINFKKYIAPYALKFENKKTEIYSKDYKYKRAWINEIHQIPQSNEFVSMSSYIKYNNLPKFVPIKITDITQHNIVETYDISVPDKPEFVINQGFVVHNSATLCIGQPEDDTFINLKNYERYPYRINHGWMSNNSVALCKKEDFEKYIPIIADRIKSNGEPGIINIYNIQKYGKYGKVAGIDPDVRVDKATLVNPCITGDTIITTSNGRFTVVDLIGKQFIALCHGREYPSTNNGFWSNGNKQVYRITLENENSIKATINHKFMKSNFYFTEVQDLHIGDELILHNHTTDTKLYTSLISSIEKLGIEEVYDCTIPLASYYDANGFVSHNCSEICLEPFEVCNLSEVFPTRCSTEEELINAAKIATFYSSTVTLLPTHRQETNRIIERNRRIGVSMSGVADWRELKGAPYVTSWFKQLYKIIRQTNKELAEEAGIPESIRVTAIKPSGTISILAGVSSGMHFPTFKYAIRRIRVAEHSPIVKILQGANIPNEPDTYSKQTLVFEFPVDLGHSRKAKDVSAWEQFALLATLQREYSDNMVSTTIYFDKDKEGEHIANMLTDYIPVLKSVSMLPHSEEGSYKQMPFEGITKEQYEDKIKTIKEIDWTMFGNSDGAEEKYCGNDACMMK